MCTGVRFSDDNGNMFMGRNLDWSVGYGQKVVITPREYVYNSAFLGEMKQQAGAIIGMAIIEENTPLYFDCYNEAGLGIAGLNFPGYASYEPDAVDGKTNVAAYEFPLWVALNFSSVDEAEEALKNVAIVAKPINDKYPVSELHFIIGDGKRSIVVEYTKKCIALRRKYAAFRLHDAKEIEESLHLSVSEGGVVFYDIEKNDPKTETEFVRVIINPTFDGKYYTFEPGWHLLLDYDGNEREERTASISVPPLSVIVCAR